MLLKQKWHFTQMQKTWKKKLYQNMHLTASKVALRTVK